MLTVGELAKQHIDFGRSFEEMCGTAFGDCLTQFDDLRQHCQQFMQQIKEYNNVRLEEAYRRALARDAYICPSCVSLRPLIERQGVYLETAMPRLPKLSIALGYENQCVLLCCRRCMAKVDFKDVWKDDHNALWTAYQLHGGIDPSTWCIRRGEVRESVAHIVVLQQSRMITGDVAEFLELPPELYLDECELILKVGSSKVGGQFWPYSVADSAEVKP